MHLPTLWHPTHRLHELTPNVWAWPVLGRFGSGRFGGGSKGKKTGGKSNAEKRKNNPFMMSKNTRQVRNKARNREGLARKQRRMSKKMFRGKVRK